MSYKKAFHILSFLVILTCCGFAQIHQYVGIVHGDYSQEISDFLHRMQEELADEGYVSLSKVIDAHRKGTGGSGFVYIASDGTNYVLTNNHVVAQASTFSFEITSQDGVSKKYESLHVLAVDEELDLAILAFPKGEKPFASGLQFYANQLVDGQDIWSAGFPSFGEYQIWQLGKGTVTNAIAKVPDLISPEVTTLIQHSAQVDPGNSGGPLMIKNDKAKGGYLVVGINTWKALNRQAANYAMPAKAIQAFIKRFLPEQTIAADDAADAGGRARSFLDACKTKTPAYKDIAKYVSNAYVQSEGEDALLRVLRMAPTNVCSYIEYVFVNYSPIEGMRLAIAYEIQRMMENERGAIEASPGNVAKDAETGEVSIDLQQEGLRWVSSWKKENQVWRLRSFSKIENERAGNDKDNGKAKEKKKDSKEKESASAKAVRFTSDKPYTGMLVLGYNRAVSGEMLDQLEASAFFSLSRGVAMGLVYQYVSDEVSGSSYTSHTFIPALRLKYPLNFTLFCIAPYFQGGYGISSLSGAVEDKSTFLDLRVGLHVSVDVNLPISFVLGISYAHQSFNGIDDIMYQSGYISGASGNSLSIAAGIAF